MTIPAVPTRDQPSIKPVSCMDL